METETYTVRLVVPKGLIPAGRTIKELRSLDDEFGNDEWIAAHGDVRRRNPVENGIGSFRIVLNPAPTWTPPASLSDGLYRWAGDVLCYDGGTMTKQWLARVLRDWIDPPANGRWKIENGKATYLGA